MAQRRLWVTSWQPFPSRFGRDTVLSLSFPYDAGLVAVLKNALQEARTRLGLREVAGGWLGEHRKWFVESAAWPFVRQRLLAAGCVLEGDFTGDGPAPQPGSPKAGAMEPRHIIKAWYREMALRFHPDRTLDNGSAMKAINLGYERLSELFGLTR